MNTLDPALLLTKKDPFFFFQPFYEKKLEQKYFQSITSLLQRLKGRCAKLNLGKNAHTLSEVELVSHNNLAFIYPSRFRIISKSIN